MLNNLGFDKWDLADHALAKASVESHFLKFGFSVVGMQRDIASSNPGTTTIYGFYNLPLPREGFRPVRAAFLRDRNSPHIPANMELRKGSWFSDTIRPWTRKVLLRMSNRVDQRR